MKMRNLGALIGGGGGGSANNDLFLNGANSSNESSGTTTRNEHLRETRICNNSRNNLLSPARSSQQFSELETRLAGVGKSAKTCQTTSALQLAAIVHYDSLASYCRLLEVAHRARVSSRFANNERKNNKSPCSPDTACDRVEMLLENCQAEAEAEAATTTSSSGLCSVASDDTLERQRRRQQQQQQVANERQTSRRERDTHVEVNELADDTREMIDVKQDKEAAAAAAAASKVRIEHNKISGGGKFSRLFFIKNKSKRENKTEFANVAERGMIDTNNGPDEAKVRVGAPHSGERPAKFWPERSSPKSTKSKMITTRQQTSRDDDDETSTQDEGATREKGASRSSKNQVIEFKFDLIVECNEPEQTNDDNDDELTFGERQTNTNENEVPASTGTSRKILRPIEQRKLLDQVNELVESFVLDSMDVCLMTTGRNSGHSTRSEAYQLGGGAPSGSKQFEYLLQSAELCLAYAFQLLEAVRPAAGSSLPTKVDEHSIELEAHLILVTRAAHYESPPSSSSVRHLPAQVEIVNLLACGRAANEENRSLVVDEKREINKRDGPATRECANISQALELIKLIGAQLERLTGEQVKTIDANLIVNLKLKRQVQSGLFTNRMCLLDLGERPRASQLRPVLETIFSGQALAYLKEQKLRLQLLDDEIANTNKEGGQEFTRPSSSLPMELEEEEEVELEVDKREKDREKFDKITLKHRHQIASAEELKRVTNNGDERSKIYYRNSLANLIEAEWLVYKRLSSALIKSLLIVHCQKLTNSQASQLLEMNEDSKLIETYLMEYNLNLLDFAQAIKRAATFKLKKRKRHLKSHLSRHASTLEGGSKLSLASDRLTYNNSNKYKGVSHRSSPNDDSLRDENNGDFCLRRLDYQDLMISSGQRQHKTRRNCYVDTNGHYLNASSAQLKHELAAGRQQHKPFVLPVHLLERYPNLASREGPHRTAGHRHRHRHCNSSRPAYNKSYHRYRRQCECYECLMQDSQQHNKHNSHQQHCRRRTPPPADVSVRSGGRDKSSRHAHRPRATSLNRQRSSDLSRSLSSCRKCSGLDDDDDERDDQDCDTSSQVSETSESTATAHNRTNQAGPLAPRADRRLVSGCKFRDPNDSLASTTLRTSSLRPKLSLGDACPRQWARNVTTMRERHAHLNRSPSEQSAATLDDSIELQSLSSGSNGFAMLAPAQLPPPPPPLPALEIGDLETGGRVSEFEHDETQLDDAQNNCCDDTVPLGLVAEPPRQLKLEQFLNQLTSFIGPAVDLQANVNLSPELRASGGVILADRVNGRRVARADDTGKKVNNCEQDEDENSGEDDDCRSHSSILEHLSSLTLESNLRMVKQQQQQQQQHSTESRVSIVGDPENDNSGLRWHSRSEVNANGHLQQLLKSTLRFQQQHQQQQQHKPLTIDCDSGSQVVSRLRTNGDKPNASVTAVAAAAAATQNNGQLHSTSEGFTPPASIESGCSSSSSSSSSGRRQAIGAASGAMNEFLVANKASTLGNGQLFANTIIKQN